MYKKDNLFCKVFTFFTLTLLTSTAGLAERSSKINYKQIDPKTQEITIDVSLDDRDFIYQDYINVSSDNGKIEISKVDIEGKPKQHFSKEFRETKNIYEKSFTVKIKTINKGNKSPENTNLHLSYYLNSKNSIVEDVIPFDEKNLEKQALTKKTQENLDQESDQIYIKNSKNASQTGFQKNSKDDDAKDDSQIAQYFNQTQQNNQAEKNIQNSQSETNKTGSIENILEEDEHEVADQESVNNTKQSLNSDFKDSDVENSNKKSKENKTWAQYFQDLLRQTESTWIRIIFALILGMLLSLTPCIYPMIPITVGIIQSHGSKSFLSNLSLSLVYSMGIAITFATLGLIAAFTGQVFGTILSNPFFIITIVTLLIYLALSMFGFYEIYMPKFMQSSGNSGSKKSIFSVFLLGIASGTFASPCVSPGLVLLLSIVTAIGSKLLGFLLLFAFGFGLGTPLIIAGTFSGSLNKLPRAGMWMLEIKKIFGLLIFGVCFYFLKNILPETILTWIMSGSLLAAGIYYIYTIKPYDSKFWKLFKNIIGITFCALSVIIIFNSYKDKYIKQNLMQEEKFWQNDYEKALEQAKTENKKLFIDLTTKVCSVCKAIESKVFENKNITKELKNKFVNVKVVVEDPSKEPYASLAKNYNLLGGFPTFLLIDPNTGTLIQKWSSEFYSMSESELINLFRELN